MISAHTDRPLIGTPVAVLDFETTGVDPTTCWPVQVAVVHTTIGDEGGELVYQSKVAIPDDVEIPAEATAVHGIRREDLVDAPSLEDVLLGHVLPALDGHLLCAYNLPYDYRVLHTACDRADIVPPRFGGLDPLVLVRRWRDRWAGNNLGEVAKLLGVELTGAHDAGADALATSRLIKPLLRECLKTWKASWGTDTFRKRAVAHNLRAFCEAQAETARVIEADMARWFIGKGKTWDGFPWHDLTGAPIPVDLDRRPADSTVCKGCGAEVLVHTRDDGHPVPLDPEPLEGLVPAPADGTLRDDLLGGRFVPLRLDDGRVVMTCLVARNHPLRPGDRWVSGRTNHWLTCSRQQRRTA